MKTSVNSVQCVESSRLTERLPIFSLSERGSGSPSEAAPVAGRNQSESVANCPDSVPTESTAKLREGSALNSVSASDRPVTSPFSRFERFWVLDVATGCHVWTGAVQSRGYGNFAISSGKSMLAHRAAWLFAMGEIPDGLTVDHVCTNKLCVNIGHMQLVSAAENNRLKHARATTCVHGHNVQVRVERANGTKRCIACIRVASLGEEKARAKYPILFALADEPAGDPPPITRAGAVARHEARTDFACIEVSS